MQGHTALVEPPSQAMAWEMAVIPQDSMTHHISIVRTALADQHDGGSVVQMLHTRTGLLIQQQPGY